MNSRRRNSVLDTASAFLLGLVLLGPLPAALADDLLDGSTCNTPNSPACWLPPAETDGGLPNGSPCTANDQCASHFCVVQVCGTGAGSTILIKSVTAAASGIGITVNGWVHVTCPDLTGFCSHLGSPVGLVYRKHIPDASIGDKGWIGSDYIFQTSSAVSSTHWTITDPTLSGCYDYDFYAAYTAPPPLGFDGGFCTGVYYSNDDGRLFCPGQPAMFFHSAATCPPGPPPQPQTPYRGCYTDDAAHGALPYVVPNYPPLDVTGTVVLLPNVESCREEAAAAGYLYAGLQGRSCFAGNTLAYTKVADTECNIPCYVNAGEMCGGALRNSVWAAIRLPDGAAFVSQSVPTSMTAGQTATVSVTMQNSGMSTWSAGQNYKLGSQGPQDNINWGLNRILLDANDSIVFGQSKTFTFNITAPLIPGTYTFEWMMLKELVGWFGADSPATNITVTAPLTAPLVIDSFTANTTSVSAGTPIAVTLNASGSIAPLQWAPFRSLNGSRYWIPSPSPPFTNVVYHGNGATWYWIPTAADVGTWTLAAWARGADSSRWGNWGNGEVGTGVAGQAANLTVTVTAPLTAPLIIDSFAASATSVSVGTPLAVTLNASGSTAPLQWAPFRSPSGSGYWTPTPSPPYTNVVYQGNGTTWYWTPTAADVGTWTLAAWARGADPAKWGNWGNGEVGTGAAGQAAHLTVTVTAPAPPPVVQVIWMQPGYMAGFGGAGNLVLAGSVSNVPAGTLVNVIYDQWSVGVWQSAPDTTTDSNGIWYTVIPSANFSDNYSVIAVSSGVQSPGCWSGPDSNRLIWCP